MRSEQDLSIAVVTLWAEDLIGAAHFYKDVLGLKPGGHDHGSSIHFLIGDVYLVIRPGKPVVTEPGDRFPLLAFRASSIDPLAERIKAHGIKLPWGVEEDDVSRWIMFHDPAGNLIEIAELVQTPLSAGE